MAGNGESSIQRFGSFLLSVLENRAAGSTDQASTEITSVLSPQRLLRNINSEELQRTCNTASGGLNPQQEMDTPKTQQRGTSRHFHLTRLRTVLYRSLQNRVLYKIQYFTELYKIQNITKYGTLQNFTNYSTSQNFTNTVFYKTLPNTVLYKTLQNTVLYDTVLYKTLSDICCVGKTKMRHILLK